MNEMIIADRKIGSNHPPVVIAEIGINHGGSIDLAIHMADLAISAGAEIVKHQTHIVDDEMSSEAKRIIPQHTSQSIYEIISKCALSEIDEKCLMNYVVGRKRIFISTPFSRAAVDRLASFDVPAFKIGSGECNNYPLIKYVAKFGKPVILSTGMNSISSIKPSVEILRNGGIPFALLHCTNIYPTPPEVVRLGAIKVLQKEFPDAVVGLSDHTTSNYVSFGAVSLGASILERHFTDTMDRAGPDICCSMDPTALHQLIEGSKIIHLARGNAKNFVEQEISTMAFAFASVVAIKDIDKGEMLSSENIWVKRPGSGEFNASDYESLLGRVACKNIKSGTQLKKSDIKNELGL
jgi:N-acetylneuraminate synthase